MTIKYFFLVINDSFDYRFANMQIWIGKIFPLAVGRATFHYILRFVIFIYLKNAGSKQCKYLCHLLLENGLSLEQDEN